MMRKLLLILLFLLLFVSPGRATISIVAGSQKAGTNTSFGVATSSAAHDAYVMMYLRTTTGATINSVTDSNGNSWHAATTLTILPSFTVWATQIWYSCDISVATTTNPTVNVNLSSGNGSFWFVELAGTNTGSSTVCFDQSNQASTSNAGTAGTQFSSGNVTTTAANEILFQAGLTNNGQINAPSPWLDPDTFGTHGTAGCGSFTCFSDQIVSSTGTFNGAFTSGANNDQMVAEIATFSASGGGSTTPKHKVTQDAKADFRTMTPPGYSSGHESKENPKLQSK